jgi:putative membrane protein
VSAGDGDATRQTRVFDPGLQQERTMLAWDRTGLALIITGALFVRAGKAPYVAAPHLPGFLAIAMGAIVLATAARRYRGRDRGLRAGGPAARPGMVRLTALVVLVLSIASTVLVLLEG